MTFDNEKQRELILTLIQNAPMRGSFDQIERATDELRVLRDSVLNAGVKKEAKNDEKEMPGGEVYGVTKEPM